ncbi:PIN domain-containing protein [Achromobacter denitrificans]|uniref:PIN domain-containing protein n=1 Tax=Achromobacter denitrificans TaxID=32002 RepID=UPI003B96E096
MPPGPAPRPRSGPPTNRILTAAPATAPFIVLDACVLMSGILRRLLLRLAEAGVFVPVWTDRIGEEWRRNASRIWTIPPEVMNELWDDMNARFPAAREVDTQVYEASLRYSDPKDFHVIAAGLARRARCGLQQPPVVQVLTWNLKDFNRSELRRQGLDVYNPDRMLVQWWQAGADPIRAAVAQVPADYVALGREPEPLSATLHRERLYGLKNLLARDAAPAA